MSEMQHTLLLTSLLWDFIFNHINYFFEVILQQNVTQDFDRIRVLLTPFSINHINLKRKTFKYILFNKREHA